LKAVGTNHTVNFGKSTNFTISTIPEAPHFNPPPSQYPIAQNVSIYTISPVAEIRYTTNGSEPTQTSTIYTSPIQVPSTLRIRAKSFLILSDGTKVSSPTSDGDYYIGSNSYVKEFVTGNAYYGNIYRMPWNNTYSYSEEHNSLAMGLNNTTDNAVYRSYARLSGMIRSLIPAGAYIQSVEFDIPVEQINSTTASLEFRYHSPSAWDLPTVWTHMGEGDPVATMPANSSTFNIQGFVSRIQTIVNGGGDYFGISIKNSNENNTDHYTSYNYPVRMRIYYRGNVEISQLDKDNAQFGQVDYWNATYWDPKTVPATVFKTTNITLKSYQDFKLGTTQKYKEWLRQTDVVNYNTFPIVANQVNYFDAKFENAIQTPKVSNFFTEITSLNPATDKIFFKDPWLIDELTTPYGMRNQGITGGTNGEPGADWHELDSPIDFLLPAFSNYKGVFLNQPIISGKPYYSVKTDEVQSIDLGGTIGTRDFYFQNWSAYPPGSASFQNADALETPVVFKSDGATVQANLKGHLFTNSSTATAPNNQRKIVQGSNGYWAMVYVSMNQVWLSRSTDGVNWEREIKISDWDTGINGYPSIDIYNDLAYVVWQNIDWYGIGGWSTCFINVRRFDLTNNTLGPTITAASFEPPTESFISTPVIAYPGGKSNEIALAWRETDGIKIIHGDGQLGDDNITWGNVFAIPGTNSYSSNPSIAYASGYNFALCWSHNYSGNKIYYSTASKTYNPEWTFSNAAIISPGDWESNINPQITNRYKPTIVWTSRNNIVEGRSSVHIRQRSGLGTSDTWGNITTYSPSTSENLSPVIGDYYGLNKMDVLWNIGNTLYKASYNGTSWVGPTTLTTSGGSGVNINRTTAYQTKAIFKNSDNTIAFYNVGGTAPPSKIVASSEDKETTLPYRLNRHAIIELPKDIDSTAKGSISFEIAGISTIYNDSETKINYSFNENNLLASEPVKVAATGMQLSFSGAIYGSGLELPDKFVTTINEPLAKVILKDSKTNETLQNIWVNNSAMLNQVKNKTFGEFRNLTVDLNKYLGKTVYVQVEMFGKSKNIAPLIVDDYLILSDSSSIANSVAKKNLAVYNLPTDYTLMQNYPNPFNPVTTISFFIPQNDYVTLKIYNTLGEEVMTAINENLEQGYHSVNINMSNEPSGVYLYSISAGSLRDTKKLLLLK
jgi:hypothetical protein